MAYLDTRQPIAAAPYASSAPAIAATIEAGFDRREWEVIVLAREDGLASLGEPSHVARLLDRLFGFGINRRLANPRLEALRHFAVQAWHSGYALPVSAVRAFKEAGFSMDQAELLLASVSVGRSERGRPALA